MKKGIIGRKLGMTQLFNEKGDVLAVLYVKKSVPELDIDKIFTIQ